MANIKVSEMTEATSFDDGDYTMIVQANQNKKIKKENVLGDIENNISTINNNIGDLSNLETDDKSNIVNSINELKGREIYSTNEIKTNKIWIDGKPIYRKVISIPSFSNTTITVSTGITNIEEVINFQGSYSRKGYTRRYSIDNIYMDEWNINLNDGIITIKTNNQYVQYSGYITIEYTKTTD